MQRTDSELERQCAEKNAEEYESAMAEYHAHCDALYLMGPDGDNIRWVSAMAKLSDCLNPKSATSFVVRRDAVKEVRNVLEEYCQRYRVFKYRQYAVAKTDSADLPDEERIICMDEQIVLPQTKENVAPDKQLKELFNRFRVVAMAACPGEKRRIDDSYADFAHVFEAKGFYWPKEARGVVTKFSELWCDVMNALAGMSDHKRKECLEKRGVARGSGLRGPKTEYMKNQLEDFVEYITDPDICKKLAGKSIISKAKAFWEENKKTYDCAAKQDKKSPNRGYSDYKALATAYKNLPENREEQNKQK